MEKFNLKFLGFSFTGYGNERSFGKIFESLWNANNDIKVNVDDISYGGLSINALSGLINGVLKNVNSDDIICLEIATSFYSQQAYTVEDAKIFVLYLIDYLSSRQINFFFLNLYRYHLDDDDCVVQAIRFYAELFNIKVLDLKKSFRHEATNNGVVLTELDLVHPNTTARTLIAENIQKFMLMNNGFFSEMKYRRIDGMKLYSYYDLSTLSAPALEAYLYEGRGKSLNSIVLLPGSHIEVSFPKSVLIKGFYFLYGPETGYVSLSTSSRSIELITYDENSYYRRVGFRHVELFCDQLSISSEHKVREIKLVKDSSIKRDSRRDFICGLLIED